MGVGCPRPLPGLKGLGVAASESFPSLSSTASGVIGGSLYTAAKSNVPCASIEAPRNLFYLKLTLAALFATASATRSQIFREDSTRTIFKRSSFRSPPPDSLFPQHIFLYIRLTTDVQLLFSRFKSDRQSELNLFVIRSTIVSNIYQYMYVGIKSLRRYCNIFFVKKKYILRLPRFISSYIQSILRQIDQSKTLTIFFIQEVCYKVNAPVAGQVPVTGQSPRLQSNLSKKI